MGRPAHLLLAVSAHGYGHLAQCAPVINTLWERDPGLRLTVLSALPRIQLARRLAGEFDYIAVETDPVLRMRSAWEVDGPASCRAYGEFHRQHAMLLESTCDQLRALGPDLVLANIPWVVLQAARQAGIPAVALGSLNWAAIYAAYCGTAGEHADILAWMLDGYRAAGCFIVPAPALPMPELDNCHPVGPIAPPAVPRPAALREALALPAEVRTVLVGLGGIDSRLPLENWPRIDGVVWLFPGALERQRDDFVAMTYLPMAFADMLASVDAVLTKPGYGTYAEAVCSGVALLTLARPDWPETGYLNDWARTHGRLQEITLEQFASGNFARALRVLWQEPLKPLPVATGVGEAVDLLTAMLAG